VSLDTLEQRAKAFHYLFDAAVVTDMNGRITDWNKGSETLYGYTKKEAIGQLVSVIYRDIHKNVMQNHAYTVSL
jgi:PAS domain S-box-containing protein